MSLTFTSCFYNLSKARCLHSGTGFVLKKRYNGERHNVISLEWREEGRGSDVCARACLPLLLFALAIFHVNSAFGENTCCHLSLFRVHISSFVQETQRLMQTSPSLIIKGVLRLSLPTHVHIWSSVVVINTVTECVVIMFPHLY